MSSRIKELVIQARAYALDQKRRYESIHNTEQCLEDYREVYNIKFAELIIRECLAIVEPSSYQKAYPDNMLGGIDGLELLYNRAERIREHFDV